MSFKVETERFTGPLDLLLALIENKKIPVEDILVSNITDDYLKSIDNENLPPSEFADYIVILVRLLYLKSHQILKLPVEEPLFDQLYRFAFVKEARKNLKSRLEEAFPLHSLTERVKPIFIEPTFKLNDLQNSLQRFLEQEKEQISEFKIQSTVKIEEALKSLGELIEKEGDVEFQSIELGRGAILVYFLAMLLLLKDGKISVDQKDIFGKIFMHKRREDTALGDDSDT